MFSKSESTVVVLQRCSRFVGRTINWLYDHLRCIPRHMPLVLCDRLENRKEFPLLEARSQDPEHVERRLWRRLMGDRLYPTDLRWLRRSRPTLLHSHFGDIAVNDVGLRDFLDVPWLVSFYGADVYQLGLRNDWRGKYADLFKRVDLVLALGPQMANRLEALGCAKDKIVVHPLGVDVDAIPSRQRVLEHGSPLRIVFAGTFREKKGVEYVIRGAAKARRAGVPLNVILVGDAAGKRGDRTTKESIFREINRLDMTDVVTHYPFVEFDRLIQIALSSHVFVAPSVTSADGDEEGTPFVLQQMMATGMPVIATAHSDIPYIFGKHKIQLVPERDADAIAARLHEYADEPERLVIDGIALKERIRMAFDVRVCAARLSDIYDVLQSRGRYSIMDRMTGIDDRHQ